MAKKLTTEEFIERAVRVHGNEYDYGLVEYVSMEVKVKFICRKHGAFEQTPHNHMRHGCYECGKKKRGDGKRMKYPEFIERAKKLHGNRYSYPFFKEEYRDCKTTKITIVCDFHGEFKQTVDSHLRLSGCPQCGKIMSSGRGSGGERMVEKYLANLDIPYEKQKIYPDCRLDRPLQFDFYLPEHNTLIEYDGGQHYKSVEFFGGEKTFAQIKLRDKTKTEYAEANGITLIRIPYWEKSNIKTLLSEALGL